MEKEGGGSNVFPGADKESERTAYCPSDLEHLTRETE